MGNLIFKRLTARRLYRFFAVKRLKTLQRDIYIYMCLPAKGVGFFGRKILSMHSFGREVKPFASCRWFAACKRSLNGVKKPAKLPDHSRPHFHLPLLRVLALIGTWRHLAAKVGTSNGRGKQWQTTPKNVPIKQRARAIPVAWLGSGSCQNRPKVWILMNEYTSYMSFAS
jgi:hypothetical protein